MSDRPCVVHLIWAPLGTAPLRRFIDSYKRHSSGAPHRLLMLYNGFAPGQDTTPWERELADIAHETLRLSASMLDLDAYRYANEQVVAGRYCFLNSYCELLADGWLAALMDALDIAGVGMAGASGSWASRSSHMRFGLHLGGPYAHVLGDPAENRQLFSALAGEGGNQHSKPRQRLETAVVGPQTLCGFPSFPAHHLRTNGFLVSAEVWKAIRSRRLRNKLGAHLLESGRGSITRQVQEMGLRVVVVGREGVYEPEHWPQSNTFWRGEQENLLIADNQTEVYARGDAQMRSALAGYAWGDAA